MNIINEIFGQGRDLNALQMSSRGIVVFVIALVLIRISGRRSFGLHMPLDNIITISLGAVLSRAIVGASDFVSVIVACLVIVSLHRFFAWLVVKSPKFSRIIEGEKILLFENGQFIDRNLVRALVSREDIMPGIRKSAQTEDITKIDKVYMERNGEISATRKQS
jgi:uncharacterized membrane protein YcaP (DUF421 family)